MTTIHLIPGETITITTDPPPSENAIAEMAQLHEVVEKLLQGNHTPLDPSDWTNWEGMYEDSTAMVRDLVAAWPHTTPTLDEVRNGRAPIEGTPLPPIKPEAKLEPLRDALMDVVAKRFPFDSQVLVNDIIDLLRHRKNIRRRMHIVPAPKVEAKPVSRIHRVSAGRVHDDPPVHIPGRTVRWTILDEAMRRVGVNGRFSVSDATDWIAEHGYKAISASPAVSDLRQMGYLIRLAPDGAYKLSGPVPTQEELAEMVAMLKQEREGRG